jgi:hypothetical protein
VLKTVTGVVNSVVGLLPVKKLITAPTPSATKSGGLLGGLLGH